MSILSLHPHRTKRDDFVDEVRAYHAEIAAPVETVPTPRRRLVPDAGRIGLAECIAADLADVAVIRATAPANQRTYHATVVRDMSADILDDVQSIIDTTRVLGDIAAYLDRAPALRHEDALVAALAQIAAELAAPIRNEVAL